MQIAIQTSDIKLFLPEIDDFSDLNLIKNFCQHGYCHLKSYSDIEGISKRVEFIYNFFMNLHENKDSKKRKADRKLNDKV